MSTPSLFHWSKDFVEHLRAVHFVLALVSIILFFTCPEWLLATAFLYGTSLAFRIYKNKSEAITSKSRTIQPILKAFEDFCLYVSIGTLLVTIECAIFRSINLYDHQVHWYQEQVESIAEFVEQRLTPGFACILLLALPLIWLDGKLAGQATKTLFAYKNAVGRLALVLTVVASFVVESVPAERSIRRSWFDKRKSEIRQYAEEIAKKRRHEVQIAFATEKLKQSTADDHENITRMMQAVANDSLDAAVLDRYAVDEIIGYEHYLVPSKELEKLHDKDSQSRETFSYTELHRIEEENAKLETEVDNRREIGLEVAKGYLESFIPETLHPLVDKFAETLIDGVVDSAADQLLPEAPKADDVFDASDLHWQMDQNPTHTAQRLAEEIQTSPEKQIRWIDGEQAAIDRRMTEEITKSMTKKTWWEEFKSEIRTIDEDEVKDIR